MRFIRLNLKVVLGAALYRFTFKMQEAVKHVHIFRNHKSDLCTDHMYVLLKFYCIIFPMKKHCPGGLDGYKTVSKWWKNKQLLV